MSRTFAVGDIHGEANQLDRLLCRLPELHRDDTVVFLGDYIDRGPESRQVIELVEAFRTGFPGRCILLRGNHEDAWLKSLDEPNPGFLLPEGNGCHATLRSFVDCTKLSELEQAKSLLAPKSWFPERTRYWIKALNL